MAEVESRTQGSRPRTAFPRTGTLEAKNRNAQGQGHKRKCSPKKKKGLHNHFSDAKKGLYKHFSGDLQKKRSSQKFFKQSPQKNVFQEIFQALHKILTIQKIVLSSSRGKANFRGLEAKDLTFEAKDFKMCPRGLHLC